MDVSKTKTSRWNKFFLALLAAVLTLLIFWAFSFVLRDIGDLPGPDREKIEKNYITQENIDTLDALRKEREELNSAQTRQKDLQQLANQTIEMLVKKGQLSPGEQETLARQSEKFQSAGVELEKLTNQLYEVNQKISRLEEQHKKNLANADEEFRELYKKHRLKTAFVKLAFIVPVLLISAWLALKYRKSPYRSLIFAAFIASFWKTVVVMHNYFPSQYFRYILVAAAIAITAAIMYIIIRQAIKPRLDWLLKQYRSAYSGGRCPVCSEPIRRGPLKDITGQDGKPRLSVTISGDVREKPYSCPSCGTRLFEKCKNCGEIRKSLLPFCQSCGDEIEINEKTS
ncbi:hypothetical protein SMSP2_02395 [Limihaloglobus sulfuriphilus]|uniref:Double zinc ribbon n=1 Tax=Limihaloglobus sulfuriphilus TaxID=1851148 RepID=A0A1R7T5Z0_9BACT|nr:hypothetical protein [Limihaloglobus sulfuriphilus]AQQ72016.1 hypothetical protein SMSP2_02395 [Limihaloglobus sulfuriphilus]